MKVIQKHFSFLFLVLFSKLLLASGMEAQHQYGPLRISFTGGPSIAINDDTHPVSFKTKDFEGRLVIRVKDAESAPETDYFEGKKRKFSMQVEGRFLREIPAERVVFGARFLKPLDVPSLFKTVVWALHNINPSFDYAINREEDGVSFFSSPLISGADRISIQELEGDNLGPWAYGGEQRIPEKENTRDFFEGTTDAKVWSFKERRSHYAKAANREAASFKPGLLYGFDFIQKDAELITFTYKHSIFPRVNLHDYLNGQSIRLEVKVLDEKGNVESVLWSVDITHRVRDTP